MGKIITVSVPEWVDEKKFREALKKALLESSPSKMSVEEIRKILGVTELREDVEVSEDVRKKEKRRLEWLY